jgi:hypothetical protein
MVAIRSQLTFYEESIRQKRQPRPRTSGKNIFKGQLTIGLDLGDRSSAYCVLNETGEIVLEHKLATTPEAMKQVFGSMPRCHIAMETGTHSGDLC